MNKYEAQVEMDRYPAGVRARGKCKVALIGENPGDLGENNT